MSADNDLDRRIRDIVGPLEEERARLKAEEEALVAQLNALRSQLNKVDKIVRLANEEPLTRGRQKKWNPSA